MNCKSAAADRGDNQGNLFARLGDVVYRSPGELKLYDGNPRRHSKKQLVKLQSSIAAFGFLAPVLITSADEVVSGAARVAAAKELGLLTIPTLCADHLSSAQVRAYRIADNRIAEEGEWDKERLAIEFEAIISAGEIQIDLTGFETAQVDLIIADADATQEKGADPADDVPEPLPPISRTGDLWHLGAHRLICAPSQDQSAWSRLLMGANAAMVFTDPPYNVAVNGHVSSTRRHREFAEASGEMSSAEFTAFLTETITAAVAPLKDGGLAYICMDHRHLPELYAAAAACKLTVLNLCVWNKTNGGMGSLYRSKHELVLVAKRGRAPHTNNVQLGKHGRYRTNVWDYAGANSFGKSRKADLADHPTVKPVALVADAIRDVTDPGEIVLDGFMGSGTTLLAAERTGRIAFGMEIEGSYVDVVIRRWEKITGKQATLAETGETLAEVAVRRSAEDIPAVPDQVPTPRIRKRAPIA